MNIKLLKAFVMLAQKGNYGDAAQALCVTQPALTKQINLLESMLNIHLFTRGRHGAALTRSGQQLLAQAEKTVSQSEFFLRSAARVAKGIEGLLAIGFGLSTFYTAPHYIAKFRQQFPAISITLEDIPSAQQYALLTRGELQIGFVRAPPTAVLNFYPLFDDRLVLVTAQNKTHSPDEWLKHLPLLRLYTERGRGLNAQTDLFLQSNQWYAPTTQEVEDIQTILALVIAGIGVALLPQSVVHIAPPGINIMPLSGENLSWQVGIAWDDRIQDWVRDNFIQQVMGSVASS
ncbi:LysR family transcriptional regulator [Yersinia enterocolitica]|uniref:LysR-family transcriptional regulatory protein n=1 Tax=Yersinia enterocolitica serotype O:8 / biotype 1B (strain NCTC 13174 / 8081) TaxID=393305 RepID=A1JMW3_YERE8|nr:LysR family transcriptional regulator [Yersinia enterocolitica]AJJ24733.1 bacterial regulatory helix-turn-helix, lysR family protein [Yersinia enterocolitica]CAL12123.1 LysR-family transcriptional regulatory protein [Yersinia enterocolitica subsp. enterocolitica 8081]CNF84282.1 LysR family transcriptional regulator [Yersinia enterocolitica]CRY01503.1 LysR family transcriptional regulator [Yersinia enterocolitica]HDL8279382.1 LysR family transcriptional regulator [Yersinia enterocolitica]